MFMREYTKCNFEFACLIKIMIMTHLSHEDGWAKAAQWLADAHDARRRLFPGAAAYEIVDSALFEDMLRAWVSTDRAAAHTFAQRLCREIIMPMDAAFALSVPLAVILVAICKAATDDPTTSAPRAALHDEPIYRALDARFAPPPSLFEFSVYAQSAAARFGLTDFVSRDRLEYMLTKDKTVSGYTHAVYRGSHLPLFDSIVFGPVRAVRECFLEFHQELDEHGDVLDEWTDDSYRAVSAEHLPAVTAYLACLGITRGSEAYSQVLEDVSQDYAVDDDDLVCHYLRAKRAARVIQRAWRRYLCPRVEAARIIQRHALHAWYCPAMPLCQRRLKKEATELHAEV